MPDLQTITARDLLRPIPSQEELIAVRNKGYDHISFDSSHRLADDPLVALRDYGIDGVSYYARPNVTGDPVPGVSPDILVKRDTAERLARVADFLRTSPLIREAFGYPLTIRVDEGLRSRALQQYVSTHRYPEFLRQTLPRQEGETDDQFEARVQHEVGKTVSKAKFPPHSGGAVVDLRLVRTDGGPDEEVSFGYRHDNRATIQTDYFEHHPEAPDAARYARNRRVMYNLMDAVGGVVNPLEPWHYGFVDPEDPRFASDGLTAVLTGRPMAYAPPIEGMPDAPELENLLARQS